MLKCGKEEKKSKIIIILLRTLDFWDIYAIIFLRKYTPLLREGE